AHLLDLAGRARLTRVVVDREEEAAPRVEALLGVQALALLEEQEARLPGDHDPGLLSDLAREGLEQELARFDLSAGQVPGRAPSTFDHALVAHEQDAVLAADDGERAEEVVAPQVRFTDVVARGHAVRDGSARAARARPRRGGNARGARRPPAGPRR